jgi:photosynthetic reaction center H subunit
MNSKDTNLKRLHKLADLKNYTVAEGDTDIRGWSVYTSDEVKIGKVEDLIVDAEIMKATYIDLILDEKLRTGKVENHLLIPLEIASIENQPEKLKLLSIVSSEIVNYPMYNGSDIPSDYETTLREKIIKKGSETKW